MTKDQGSRIKDQGEPYNETGIKEEEDIKKEIKKEPMSKS